MNFFDLDLAGIEAVVFDFGGVISYPPGENAPVFEACAKWGITREMYREAFGKYRNLWDGGEIDGVEMYRRIVEDYNPAAKPSFEDLDALWRADAEGWIGRLKPEALDYMHFLKSAGRKIGILTNLSTDFYSEFFSIRCSEHIKLADAVVVSSHEHVVKPSPEIYRIMEKRLCVSPGAILFLDDTPRNIAGAIACGWHGVVV